MSPRLKRWLLKQGIIFLIIVFLAFGINISNVDAGSEQIRSIDVHVLLHEDGTADITQVWDVKAAKGTEYYIPQMNLGDMQIENLSVYDESGKPYIVEENWNVDRSIEEKSNRCGIHRIDEGVELCWGIGSYGDHTYTLNYRLTNLVKAYSDEDGFNSRFVNDQLSAPVGSASVTIEKEGHLFSEEEVKMWAFGFEGEIFLEQGKIIAQSKEPLYSNNHMTVMTSYEKGIFSPLSQADGSFEQVKELAFSGSDYENVSEETESSGFGLFSLAILTGFIGMFGPIIFIVLIARLFFKKKVAMTEEGMKLPKYKETDYYRNLPLDGDYKAGLGVLSVVQNVPMKNILSAYFLRWIRHGMIEARKVSQSTLFGEKEEVELILKVPPVIEDPNERKLFDILREAARSDQVLQEKEFRKWSEDHYSRLENWWNKELESGKQRFRELGGLQTEEEKVLGLFSKKTDKLTPVGLSLVKQVWGFKRYLEDFSLIEERQVIEVALWEDYLGFASLLGISEKVFQELKQLYPNFARVDGVDEDLMTDALLLHRINSLADAGQRGMNHGRSAADGGGGSSSSGGGGGFSGGGSGGGSR